MAFRSTLNLFERIFVMFYIWFSFRFRIIVVLSRVLRAFVLDLIYAWAMLRQNQKLGGVCDSSASSAK
jgi:hypothetical protein